MAKRFSVSSKAGDASLLPCAQRHALVLVMYEQGQRLCGISAVKPRYSTVGTVECGDSLVDVNLAFLPGHLLFFVVLKSPNSSWHVQMNLKGPVNGCCVSNSLACLQTGLCFHTRV